MPIITQPKVVSALAFGVFCGPLVTILHSDYDVETRAILVLLMAVVVGLAGRYLAKRV
jgi:hypothetical protein